MKQPARPWTEHEDEHIEKNYSGAKSIVEIAKALKRTETSVAKRIAITVAGNGSGSKREEAQRCAAMLHSLDLLKSGGRWT